MAEEFVRPWTLAVWNSKSSIPRLFLTRLAFDIEFGSFLNRSRGRNNFILSRQLVYFLIISFKFLFLFLSPL